MIGEQLKEKVVNEIEDRTTQNEETEVGVIVGGARGGMGTPPQVPIIDALLGDIYELQYQLSQTSARMYQY